MAPCSLTRALGAVLALSLLLPAAAAANNPRYTNPAATATSGTCSLAFPCSIDYAINGASDGDTVHVAPGTYDVQSSLSAPAIDIVGDDGPRPVLVGGAGLTTEMLAYRNGGTLRHLTLRGTAPGLDTIVLEKGTAEDLVIQSAAGDGIKLVGAPGTTILRDSVVTTDSGGSAVAVRLGNPSGYDSALRNVTAVAPSATAIRCDFSSGQATLVNVIARGSVADVDSSISGSACTASYSNLRPDHSQQLALGAGIQSAEPIFADAANGDFRPLAGSPTIDAGTADPLNGTTDPDGVLRGSTPDIGAFECCGQAPAVVATPTPTPTPVSRDEPQEKKPELGSTVVVAPGQGKVLVRKPGNTHFSELGEAVELPVGTVVDTRLGRIKLTSALDDGTAQTGTFWGAQFKILQSAGGNGMTSLALRGGNFSRCPRPRTKLAHTSGVARDYPRRKVVRSLWAHDRGGRFRTYGNNSVATARGTRWVTRDRCDGTVTRVYEGSVAVRDKRRGKTVIVRAGHRYLARR